VVTDNRFVNVDHAMYMGGDGSCYNPLELCYETTKNYTNLPAWRARYGNLMGNYLDCRFIQRLLVSNRSLHSNSIWKYLGKCYYRLHHLSRKHYCQPCHLPELSLCGNCGDQTSSVSKHFPFACR
jgi:hypothetical protein